MTTAIASDPQIVPPASPPSLPALRIADQGVASALESLLFGNTRRVYGVQWRLFNDWCDLVGSCVPCRRCPSPWPATWLPAPAPAPPSPPCAWPPPPSPRPMSRPATWILPAGTGACAPL